MTLGGCPVKSGTVRYSESPVWDREGDCLLLPTVADRIEESDFNEEIYEAAGETVRKSYRRDLPLRIGNVSVTDGGTLSVSRIIHVPVQTAPGVPTTPENLQVGLRSGLVTADEDGTRTILLARPIPDDQIDEFDVEGFVETLHEDLTQYPPAHFEEIILAGEASVWMEAVKQTFDRGN
jgi:hypothetical protein